MSVPVKTFTGASGKGLGGTNGAGTVATGGLQRDITTAFAMFNPEATRPDGQPGGIQKENLATNIWDGFLEGRIATENVPGVVKVPSDFIDTTGMMKFAGMLKLHADSGWQLNVQGNTNIVWDARKNKRAVYTFTFPTPFSSMYIPYIPQVFFCESNDTNVRLGSALPYDMILTSCKLQTANYIIDTDSEGSTVGGHWSYLVAAKFRILLFEVI